MRQLLIDDGHVQAAVTLELKLENYFPPQFTKESFLIHFKLYDIPSF